MQRLRQTMREVAAEQFVGTVAGQGDLDVPGDEAGYEIGRGDAGERLVESVEHRVGAVGDLLKAQHIFMVIRAELARDKPRIFLIGRLVVQLVGIDEREGLDRPPADPRHQRNDAGAVDPAGQICAERNIGAHLQAHRILEQVADAGGGLGFFQPGVLGEDRAPPAALREGAAFEHPKPAGAQLLDAAKSAPGGRYVFEA